MGATSDAEQAALISFVDRIVVVPETAEVPEPEAGRTATPPEVDATATPQASATPQTGAVGADGAEPAPQVRPGAPAPDRRSLRAGDRTAPRVPSEFAVFAEGDQVVYPTHGVGKVVKIGTPATSWISSTSPSTRAR